MTEGVNVTRRSLGRRIESLLKRVAEHETKVQMEESKDAPDQALEGRDIGLWQEHREGKKEVGKVNRKDEKEHERLQILYDELEEECLTAVKYIEALKVKELSNSQREDLIGELSASITHLRIQAEALEEGLEEAMAA